MQFPLLGPQKRVEGKELRSREEGPRARGCEVSTLPCSRQQTGLPSPLWPAGSHLVGQMGPATAGAVPRRRSTGAPTVDSAVTVHSPAQHWKKLTIFNLAFLFFPSPTFDLIPRTRVSPVTMESHTTGAHTPSVQQPWRSLQVRLNFCWPSNEEESRELK